MPLCSNTWCLKEGELAEIDGKKLCRICAINNKSNKMIEKLFGREEIKKEVVARCSRDNCPNLIYNVDPPRKFLKSFGFEHIFSSNEVEEIVLCKFCYQKKLTIQRIKKWVLFFCLTISLGLLLLLFYWKKVSELWNEHPVKLTFFIITTIFTFLIFSSFESIISIPSKIKKTWKYIRHYFTKKEILLFQSQQDNSLYWTNEIYMEKKFSFCSMCQGGDILYKNKIKKTLFWPWN